MTISTHIRNVALPLFAVAMLASSPASANIAPKVTINGITNGAMAFNGPVQITGYAGDRDGVKEIYGTIQDSNSRMFFSPAGSFVKKPTRLSYQYNKSAKETNWTTDAYKLPAGRYVYRMRAEDGKGVRSTMVAVPFIVGRSNTTRSIAVAPAVRPTPKPATRPVARTTAQATAPVAGAKAANGMGYCSNPGMDADGDGFGWENNTSCVVAGTKADTHPNCATAGSDPDGDGWGWENERSCIVVTKCKSAASDPDGDGFGWENKRSCIVVKTGGKFSPCASAASDPDGDGYGWENNKTCLVAR